MKQKSFIRQSFGAVNKINIFFGRMKGAATHPSTYKFAAISRISAAAESKIINFFILIPPLLYVLLRIFAFHYISV